jgi:ribosome assembly protein 1
VLIKATALQREEPEGDEELPDKDMDLSPEKGNVAFASAHDGWAFRIDQFANMYAAKLGFKAGALRRALWGDYRIDAKAKRIVRIKAAQMGKVKPLFVQVGLLCIQHAVMMHGKREHADAAGMVRSTRHPRTTASV